MAVHLVISTALISLVMIHEVTIVSKNGEFRYYVIPDIGGSWDPSQRNSPVDVDRSDYDIQTACK